MSPFDPDKPAKPFETDQHPPRQTLTTSNGVTVTVRDLPRRRPPPEPPPREQSQRVVIAPDRDAFVRELEKQWGSFMRYKLRRISAESTKELKQDVLVVACTAYDRDGPPENPPAFLERVITNAICNHTGKRRPEIDREADPDDKVASASDPESAAARAERWAKAQHYISCLPPQLRQVVLARDLEGLTFEAIADRVGRPLNTVYNQHTRALEMLRDLARATERATALGPRRRRPSSP